MDWDSIKYESPEEYEARIRTRAFGREEPPRKKKPTKQKQQ